MTATFELVDKNNSELLTLQTETNFTIYQLIIVRFLITAVIKGQVIRATFSHNFSRNIVALQVEKRCCPYYHLRSQLVTQQISMLQVVAN